jgi:hypothetical protein
MSFYDDVDLQEAYALGVKEASIRSRVAEGVSKRAPGALKYIGGGVSSIGGKISKAGKKLKRAQRMKKLKALMAHQYALPTAIGVGALGAGLAAGNLMGKSASEFEYENDLAMAFELGYKQASEDMYEDYSDFDLDEFDDLDLDY